VRNSQCWSGSVVCCRHSPFDDVFVASVDGAMLSRVRHGEDSTDLTDIGDIRDEVGAMARDAAAWLLKRALYARTVTIKVRYHDFTTITRSHTEDPTRDEENIVRRAIGLLERTDAGAQPVRLLGVSVHNLLENLPTRPDAPQQRLPFEAPTNA